MRTGPLFLSILLLTAHTSLASSPSTRLNQLFHGLKSPNAKPMLILQDSKSESEFNNWIKMLGSDSIATRSEAYGQMLESWNPELEANLKKELNAKHDQAVVNLIRALLSSGPTHHKIKELKAKLSPQLKKEIPEAAQKAIQGNNEDIIIMIAALLPVTRWTPTSLGFGGDVKPFANEQDFRLLAPIVLDRWADVHNGWSRERWQDFYIIKYLFENNKNIKGVNYKKILATIDRDIKNGDPYDRYRSLELLAYAHPDRKKAIEILAAYLKNKDSSLQRQTIQSLTNLEAWENTDEIIALMKKDPKLRAAGIWFLRGAKTHSDVVGQYLNDPDLHTRDISFKALINMKKLETELLKQEPKTILQVLKLMQSNKRQHWIREACTPVLNKLIHHKDPEVIKASRKVLDVFQKQK